MVAARTPRQIAPLHYDQIIQSIDWNRVLIEAVAHHFSMMHEGYDGTNTCGDCIQTVLLRRDY